MTGNTRPPSGKAYKPPFKAIQTRYDGYHFRSRLEARWAFFFNALNIEYRYEHEGYDMEGTPYLPDFYLPKQDCFVEIKGQMPTYEEDKKASLLSLYTNKRVFLFYGEIGVSKHNYSAHGRIPPYLYNINPENFDLRDMRRVETPLHILITLQKLHDASIEVGIEEDTHDLFFFQKRLIDYKSDTETWEEFYTRYKDEMQDGITGITLAKEHHKELQDLYLAGHPERMVFFYPQHADAMYSWKQCFSCGAFDIHGPGSPERLVCGCVVTAQTAQENPSVKLLEAYKAAREARFSR